jgi:hypothetical protein
MKPSNTVHVGNRGGSSAHSEGSKDVLGDTSIRPRGVKVSITWQSVALGDAASVEPALS